MQKHTKIYFEYFDYGETDFVPCEACGREAVDVHHIQGRGKGKDVIENLIGLCRRCHDLAHGEKLSKSAVQYIHNSFMAGRRGPFIK